MAVAEKAGTRIAHDPFQERSLGTKEEDEWFRQSQVLRSRRQARREYEIEVNRHRRLAALWR